MRHAVCLALVSKDRLDASILYVSEYQCLDQVRELARHFARGSRISLFEDVGDDYRERARWDGEVPRATGAEARRASPRRKGRDAG